MRLWRLWLLLSRRTLRSLTYIFPSGVTLTTETKFTDIRPTFPMKTVRFLSAKTIGDGYVTRAPSELYQLKTTVGRGESEQTPRRTVNFEHWKGFWGVEWDGVYRAGFQCSDLGRGGDRCR